MALAAVVFALNAALHALTLFYLWFHVSSDDWNDVLGVALGIAVVVNNLAGIFLSCWVDDRANRLQEKLQESLAGPYPKEEGV
jgi:hypothetical protein